MNLQKNVKYCLLDFSNCSNIIIVTTDVGQHTKSEYTITVLGLPTFIYFLQETFADLEDKTKVIIPVLKPQNPIFELVNDEDYHLAPVASSRTTNTEQCGVNLSNLEVGDEGIIKTPNYPNNYPPNIQCIWWLKVSTLLLSEAQERWV